MPDAVLEWFDRVTRSVRCDPEEQLVWVYSSDDDELRFVECQILKSVFVLCHNDRFWDVPVTVAGCPTGCPEGYTFLSRSYNGHDLPRGKFHIVGIKRSECPEIIKANAALADTTEESVTKRN